MKIAISAESTVDLSKELLDEFKIRTLPFSVQLGDRFNLLTKMARCQKLVR